MRDNRIKGIMASGGLALGVSLTIADPFVAEVIGGAGFDFVLIDAEHSPISIDRLQMMLIALRSSESTALVRPAANDPALIKQILDLGAEGLVVPEVDDAASCAAAVAAARYPPLGRRGFGPRRAARLDGGRPAYLARADAEIAVLVMIESATAVADIDAILKTPGLDGIMVGPADLAVTMGHLGDLGHPDVGAAIAAVRDACERQSVPFGIFAATEQAARDWSAAGARFMTIGADTQFLDQGLARSRALAQGLKNQRLEEQRLGESR
jgi:2-keto-3-deoxy-L-rhamnonate aldolase RhmA